LNEKYGLQSRKTRLTAVRTLCVDHATPFCTQNFALVSPTSGGHSLGIGRLRSKSHGVCLFSFCYEVVCMSGTILCKIAVVMISATGHHVLHSGNSPPCHIAFWPSNWISLRPELPLADSAAKLLLAFAKECNRL
jgi:hypothetical protein